MKRGVGRRTARRIAVKLAPSAATSIRRCSASAWSTTLCAAIAPHSSRTKNPLTIQRTVFGAAGTRLASAAVIGVGAEVEGSWWWVWVGADAGGAAGRGRGSVLVLVSRGVVRHGSHDDVVVGDGGGAESSALAVSSSRRTADM